jgi:hypothetical protein
MQYLTDEQIEEIVQFCSDNEETDFEAAAACLSERMGIVLSKGDVCKIYMAHTGEGDEPA